MRFCQPHWKKLRKAIKKRGLDELVSRGGEMAARNLVDQMNEGPSIQNFDPLLYAHNGILANSMRLVGVGVMLLDERGRHRCPICYPNQLHAETCAGSPCQLPKKDAFDNWVELAADSAAKMYQELLAGATPDA